MGGRDYNAVCELEQERPANGAPYERTDDDHDIFATPSQPAARAMYENGKRTTVLSYIVVHYEHRILLTNLRRMAPATSLSSSHHQRGDRRRRHPEEASNVFYYMLAVSGAGFEDCVERGALVSTQYRDDDDAL